MILSRRTITVDVSFPGFPDNVSEDEIAELSHKVWCLLDSGLSAVREAIEELTDGVTVVIDQ